MKEIWSVNKQGRQGGGGVVYRDNKSFEDPLIWNWLSEFKLYW